VRVALAAAAELDPEGKAIVLSTVVTLSTAAADWNFLLEREFHCEIRILDDAHLDPPELQIRIFGGFCISSLTIQLIATVEDLVASA
jgi:hypothetical protein